MTALPPPAGVGTFRKLSCDLLTAYSRFMAEWQAQAIMVGHLAGRCLAAGQAVAPVGQADRCPRCSRYAPDDAQLAAQRAKTRAARVNWQGANVRLAAWCELLTMVAEFGPGIVAPPAPAPAAAAAGNDLVDAGDPRRAGGGGGPRSQGD